MNNFSDALYIAVVSFLKITRSGLGVRLTASHATAVTDAIMAAKTNDENTTMAALRALRLDAHAFFNSLNGLAKHDGPTARARRNLLKAIDKYVEAYDAQ